MAEVKEVRLPDIGDFDNVPVIEILVKPGDSVAAEDSLITLESEKATMDVPAPFAGTVKSIEVSEGDEVSQGDLIAKLEAQDQGADGDGEDGDGENDAPEGDPAATDAESDSNEDDKESPAAKDQAKDEGKDQDTGRQEHRGQPPQGPEESRKPPIPHGAERIMPDKVPYASPAVRQFARELGVDLAQVEGTARKGRIIREDVQRFVKGVMQGKSSAPGAAPAGGLAVAPPPKVDFSKFGEVEEQKLSRIKKISGPALHRNWVTIPHVTQHDQADITDMEAFRQQQKDRSPAKLTPLVFIIKAVVAGLREYPHFNASLSADGESLILKKYFNVGVAVETPGGLVVPVLRDCERKGIFDLAVELGELSEKARDGKLSPGEMQGGCISISSLGGIGGTAFTPIVNLPEVAILGVSRSAMQPVWDGKQFQPRLMLPLSLSYDHRVIDGADAARFTRHVADCLGDLRRLLL